MKDESSSKITSKYHSVYVDKCSQKFHSHSRPLGTEIAPLLSTRGEKGGLLLPCDEPNLNAAWPKFAAQPQQPFSLNDEFGGVHGPSASDADRNPAFPNHRAATRLMLAGGGWPGAAGSGAATGSAAERSLPPLPSWLAAAAAASAGSTDYLQGRALPARPLALAAGSGHRARLARLVRGTRPAGGLSAGNRGATGLLVAAAAAAAAMTGGV